MKNKIIEIIRSKQRHVLGHKDFDGDTKNISHALLGDVANEVVLTDFTCATCKFWNQTDSNEGFCSNSPVSLATLESIDIELIEHQLSTNDRENIKNLILGGLRTDKDFGCINYHLKA